jgi:putative ABC transport system permease protein
LYQAEERLRQVVVFFASLAIFIAGLGLLGLASFLAEQRTREIGIRKILGATVAQVTVLLSKDFLKLVIAANLIAWPVAWYVMKRWLENFAYRSDISWWIFLMSGGVALVIALLTVSFQAIRAALANPVESLRYE